MKTTFAWLFSLMLLVAMGSVLTVCSTQQEDRPVPVVASNDLVSNPDLPPPTPTLQKARVKIFGEMGCEPRIILKETGTILYPEYFRPDFKLMDGQFVNVGFMEVIPSTNSICPGVAVSVYDIELRQPDPDEILPNTCSIKARVVDVPDRLEGCMLNIQLRDGRLLYPLHMEPEFKLREHDLVSISFEPISSPQPYECIGEPVIITCITLRNADQEDYFVPLDKRPK